MRGVAIRFALVLCVNVVYGANYTDYSLPSTITLRANEQRQDTTISAKGNGEAYSFSANAVQIIGASGATYELKADNRVTTFHLRGGFTLNNQARFALTGYHTLAFESGGISVGSNSQLSYISSTQNISAGGTEYGGNPKVRFGRGTSLSLGINASATFSDTSIFIHDGGVNISQGANLKIEATKSIRFQESLTNNGGTITLTGNTYNIGGKRGNAPNDRTTIANFQSTNGTIIVNGNFYNGGQADNAVDITGNAGGFNVFDPAFGGGGNLNIYGGSMTINGSLISTKGGDGVWGGDIINPQNSSIGIYGGNLTATGGVQNLVGSTLTIGADSSGKMGQIAGNLTNNGAFIVDAKGAVAGNHTLITGNFSGNAPTLINGNSDFANATLTDNTTLNVTINQAQINHFKSTLNSNESATLARFGESIYTISGASSTNLKSSANDINRAIFSAFYIANLSAIESLSADFSANITPQTKRKITTKRNNVRQTRQRQVKKITTKSANPNDLNAGFVVQGISGSANGILGGIRAGYGRNFERGRFALNFAYAYGNLKNALNTFIATQNLTTKSHNVAFSANLNAKIAGDFGVDLGLGGFMIMANHTREISANAVDSRLKSNQNVYQIAVDLAFVYDFKITNFLIAPYLGLNQGFLAMPKFAEVGGGAFALNVEAHNSYFLSALMGAKMGFDFGNYGAIFSKVDYNFLAYNAQKTHTLRYANSADFLIFAVPNTHKIAFDLGYHKDFGSWYLRVNGSFGAIFSTGKAQDTSANFYNYGINGTFGYRF